MAINGDQLRRLWETATKICKEKQYEEMRMNLEEALKECARLEVACRRAKASELIREANKIECKILLLEQTYQRTRQKSGRIVAIEDYIQECKKYRDSLLREKNRLK